MSDEPKNWNDALDKSDLTMSIFASKDDLIRALRAENERLREALTHYATDESPDGWVAIAVLETKKGPGD